MNTTTILGEAVGIQRQDIIDRTEEQTAEGLTGAVILGRFKRGRFDALMEIHLGNIRGQLGYDPKNPDYIAVQDCLDTGVPSIQVLRVKDSDGNGDEDNEPVGGKLHYILAMDQTGRFAITNTFEVAKRIYAIEGNTINFSKQVGEINVSGGISDYKFSKNGDAIFYYFSDSNYTNYEFKGIECVNGEFSQPIIFSPPINKFQNSPDFDISHDATYLLLGSMITGLFIYKKTGIGNYTLIQEINNAGVFTGLAFSPDETKFCFLRTGDAQLTVYSFENEVASFMNFTNGAVNPYGNSIVNDPKWLNNSFIYRDVSKNNDQPSYLCTQFLIEVHGHNSLTIAENKEVQDVNYACRDTSGYGVALAKVDRYSGKYGAVMLNAAQKKISTKDFNETVDSNHFLLESNENQTRIAVVPSSLTENINTFKVLTLINATGAYSIS